MEQQSHDSQLLKGVLGLVLLRLLAEQESYGYELVTRVHDIGLVDVPEGSVYPALSRLEREGQVTSRLVPSTSGPARKYYAPSIKGYRYLNHAEAAWNSLTSSVAALLNGPIPTTPKEAS